MEQTEQLELLKRLGTTGLEEWFSISRGMIDQLEAALGQQTAAALDLWRRSLSGSEALLSVSDLDGLNRWQAEHFQAGFEQAVAFFRQQIDLALRLQKDYAGAVQTQAAGFTRQLGEAMERSSDQIPVAAKPLFDTLCSLMSTATATFENMERVASQMAEMTEANMSAIGEAAVRAGKAGATGKRKAA